MLIWDNLAHHLALDHTLQHQNVIQIGIEYALRELGDMSQLFPTIIFLNLPHTVEK
jgi:hypothetical protein